jgi:hypothetical protein
MDAYIPVYGDSKDSWYPANAAAQELVFLVHIWQDMSKLNDIRLRIRADDPIGDTLLFKHILTEFWSALDHAKKLQRIVRTAPKLIRGQQPPFRYVTRRESERIAAVFKSLWRDLALVESELASIRNNIGAHRSGALVHEGQTLWSKIEPDKFIPLVNRIPELIQVLQDVNIFDWSWVDPESSRASIFGTRIVHDWQDAFEAHEA